MTRITYVPTLLYIAKKLCLYVARATPILTQLYPTNTALLSALATANAACQELSNQLAQVREFGD